MQIEIKANKSLQTEANQ